METLIFTLVIMLTFIFPFSQEPSEAMPPLKQPGSLVELSTNALVGDFVKFFRICICEESLDEFREGVAFIKNVIRSRMPGTLAVELYNEMLQEFAAPRRHDVTPYPRHMRIASELLFDDESLQMIERKFPNLKSLEMEYNFGESPLLGLKSLNKLTDIQINGAPGPCWEYLENLARTIGGNLKRLALLDTKSGACQRDLDLIFKYCVNLEYFQIDEFTVHALAKVVIPPFSKLKYFSCSNESKYHALIEYGEMPELEELALYDFDTTFKEIKSMIFDHARLPKLKMLRVTKFQSSDDEHRLQQIARVNNLDIVIKKRY